jgi:beta-glucosidase
MTDNNLRVWNDARPANPHCATKETLVHACFSSIASRAAPRRYAAALHVLIMAATMVLGGAGMGRAVAAAAASPMPAIPPAPAASVHPELWPAAPQGAARPAGTDALVEKLLAAMRLEEKIAQMIQADIASIKPADLYTYKLGSILAGGGAAPDNNIRSTPHAWLNLAREFHRAALESAGTAHPPIPVLFGIDAVHGHAKILGATIFPHNIGLGAAHDPALIRRIGEATAAEVSGTGIDWTFAPTVAVVRDVRWGRSYESYSEDPALVADYAAAMVTGLQGKLGSPQFLAPGRTLSSVKHFLGDGGTTAGRDQGDTAVPEEVLRGIHGAGYPAAIRAGVQIVMASYNSWNGVKLHSSHYLLTDILKARMGFDGFVVGDWNAHEQIPGCTKASCPAAILAGVDMLMAPDSWKALYENTLAQARSGEIPTARIDDAVRRILRVKVLAGLFSRTDAGPRDDSGLKQLGSAAHRAIAREAVRKSLVLLKNTHDILPLKPNAAVLVTGMAADDIGTQAGGWTIDWQGDHNSNQDFHGATSIFAGIKAAVTRGGGSVVLSPDGSFTQKPDVAIVVFGEKPYAEFQGDRETLEFSPRDKSQLRLLRQLHAAGIPVVSVFLSGRPLWVNPEINASDAFVAAWLPGSEGEGIADVLFRAADGTPAYDFTGRLSFSWPATAMPVSFDAAGSVSGALFARGSGLDYGRHPELPQLPEDAQIPEHWRAPPGSLFHAAHPTAPWTLFIADRDAEIHVTTHSQRSPHGAVTATLESSGEAFKWNGAERGLVTISGRPIDLRDAAGHGGVIQIRYRIDQVPEQAVALGVRCAAADCGTSGGAFVDVTRNFKGAAVGAWNSLSVPISCLHAKDKDLAEVAAPFALSSSGRFGVTIAEVSLTAGHDAATAACP